MYLIGVFLSLNGVSTTIPNDSYVLVTDFWNGFGGTGLYCSTDRNDCCRASDHPNGIAQGHWYRPDGREVLDSSTEYRTRPYCEIYSYFHSSRSRGVVYLFRETGSNSMINPPERGRFRCEIPDASGVNVTLYVNIGEHMHSLHYHKLSSYELLFHSSGYDTSYHWATHDHH